jgi:CRP-like cAMP-binding protein
LSNTEELERRLAEVPLFARCARADLWVVAQRCDIRPVPTGTAVLRAGEPGDEFFVLLDGKVEVQREGAVLSQLGPGDHFGELAVLDPAPRNADVIVTSDATLGVLSHAQFRLVLDAVPGVAEAMLSFLARRVRDESRHGVRADL